MGPEQLPDWLGDWCEAHLGNEPVEILFERTSISNVVGVRLSDGQRVVVKARADDGRAEQCVAVQRTLADRGLPCPRPITPVTRLGSRAVHAEEFVADGQMLAGTSPAIACRYAEVFALIMLELEHVSVPPPLPNPRWLRWDHSDGGPWPAIDFLDSRDQGLVPDIVVEVATRARRRLRDARLPCVLGHGDFEAQNLRWLGRRIRVIHDWDSLTWQPEAALVGAASGTFVNTGQPTLAPVESSEAFIEAYEARRGRAFNPLERQVAWAASLWPAAHNARWEALHGDPPVANAALFEQADVRLRRAEA